MRGFAGLLEARMRAKPDLVAIWQYLLMANMTILERTSKLAKFSLHTPLRRNNTASNAPRVQKPIFVEDCLKKIDVLTKIECVLNTSLNLYGKAIAKTPEQKIELFQNSG